jgi:hypothetical protein
VLSLLLLGFIVFGSTVEAAHTHGSLTAAQLSSAHTAKSIFPAENTPAFLLNNRLKPRATSRKLGQMFGGWRDTETSLTVLVVISILRPRSLT